MRKITIWIQPSNYTTKIKQFLDQKFHRKSKEFGQQLKPLQITDGNDLVVKHVSAIDIADGLFHRQYACGSPMIYSFAFSLLSFP